MAMKTAITHAFGSSDGTDIVNNAYSSRDKMQRDRFKQCARGLARGVGGGFHWENLPPQRMTRKIKKALEDLVLTPH